MKVWADLVGTAMVGTERRTFAFADELRPLVGPALPAVAEAEGQVLAAAAVVGNYRLAGRRPARGSAPVPAPPHDRPACSDTAAQLLALLLGGMVPVAGGTAAMVEAWLTACAGTGLRPPDRMLVPLLDLATATPRLRPAVAAAAGARGAWLGGANPDWAWAAPPAAPSTPADYATAPTAERVALLVALRRQDRSAATALLRSTWTSEPAAERAALLAALEPDLDEDDEPFLDDLLDDRAASVRTAAAELLDRLPRSRRAARMADRARALVRMEGRFRRKLVVQLPEVLDAAARRDGVSDIRRPGTGLHAAWLVKIVAATPLHVWEPHLGLSPSEAVARAAADNAPELLAGWEAAAVAQRSEPWATALLAHHASPALVGVLSTPAARRYAEEALRGAAVSPPDGRFFDALTLPGPWDAAFSALVVDRVRAAPAATVSSVVGLLAWRLDPVVLPGVEDWIGTRGDERSRRDVRALAHALSIRATIAQELP